MIWSSADLMQLEDNDDHRGIYLRRDVNAHKCKNNNNKDQHGFIYPRRSILLIKKQGTWEIIESEILQRKMK